MSAAQGYYSIVQYCPDPLRQEAANVGVVLFCPELDYLGVRTAEQDGRIRRFFGRRGIDREQLKAIKMSIQRRLEADRDQFTDLADLERFAATRANAMRLTSPRMISVASPNGDLDRLFTRLVVGRARKDTPKIQDVLEQAFSVEPFASLVRRNVVVVLPVFQRSIVVPYGFQSGRFNLIQPARFRSQGPTRILQRAGQYALEGDLLFNTPDPALGGRKLIVIGDFGSSQQTVARAVGRLLEKNQTKFYRLDEMDRLLELIRTAGEPVVPLDQTS